MFEDQGGSAVLLDEVVDHLDHVRALDPLEGLNHPEGPLDDGQASRVSLAHLGGPSEEDLGGVGLQVDQVHSPVPVLPHLDPLAVLVSLELVFFFETEGLWSLLACETLNEVSHSLELLLARLC